MRRDPALDGLRGVAIALVVSTHAKLTQGGWIGVSLFFTLSGYLITSLLLVELQSSGTIRMSRFYRHRAARLGPALVVALAGMTLLWATVGYGQIAVANAVVVLLYLGNIGRAFWSARMVPASWSWSLALEEQFYALWPLLLRRALRTIAPARLAQWLLALTVALTVSRFALAGHEPVVYHLLRGDELLLGSALALTGWVGRRLLLPAVVLFAGLAFWRTTSWPLSITLAALCSVVLVSCAGAVPWFRQVLNVAPLRYLGRISYSLYLWSGILTAFYDERGTSVRGYLPLAGVSVLLAVLSTHLLEEPLRRRLRGDAEVVEADARAVVPQPVLGGGLQLRLRPRVQRAAVALDDH